MIKKNKVALSTLSLFTAIILLTGCSSASKILTPTGSSDHRIAWSDTTASAEAEPTRDNSDDRKSDEQFDFTPIGPYESNWGKPNELTVLRTMGYLSADGFNEAQKSVFKAELARQETLWTKDSITELARGQGMSVENYRAYTDLMDFKVSQAAKFEADFLDKKNPLYLDKLLNKKIPSTEDLILETQQELLMLEKERLLNNAGIDTSMK